MRTMWCLYCTRDEHAACDARRESENMECGCPCIADEQIAANDAQHAAWIASGAHRVMTPQNGRIFYGEDDIGSDFTEARKMIEAVLSAHNANAPPRHDGRAKYEQIGEEMFRRDHVRMSFVLDESTYQNLCGMLATVPGVRFDLADIDGDVFFRPPMLNAIVKDALGMPVDDRWTFTVDGVRLVRMERES